MTAGEWGVPETAVMDACADALDTDAVLGTVVAVDGRAYRRPGAKMVFADGEAGIGSLTAGCLETELWEIAQQVEVTDEPEVAQFDLSGEDDVWGLGVGCEGTISVLFEPLNDSYQPVLDAYQRGTEIAAVTVLSGNDTPLACGDRTLAFSTVKNGVSFESTDWPGWILDELTATTERLLTSDTADSVTLEQEGETVRVFVDSITPQPELIIFGSGRDVRPVAELATRIDFRVTVVSFRGGDANQERFPAADRVLSMSPAELGEQLALDDNTYTVLMTHNFVDDQIALEELLDSSVPYIGLMGPAERFERLCDGLADDGHSLDRADRDRIYAPVGLDLGGDTPFHIAQSIVAELTAVHHDRDPAHLRGQQGPIHTRLPTDSASTEND